jgi:type IV pilus assembly protein PilO
MTYVPDDFIPVEGQEETPNYPTAFGITFTPKVGGIVFAVLGLLGAAYLAVNILQPAWENYQKLETEVADKKNQVKKQAELQKRIAEAQVQLDKAKQQNKQVLSLFANEKTLDTLLLDLNTFVKARNATLTSFVPKPETAADTKEPLLAAEASGKLKRKTVNLEMEGSFEQVQSILRSFERLQSLLIIRDFKTDVSTPQVIYIDGGTAVPAVVDKNRRVLRGAKPTIKANFKVEAITPVTDEATSETATPLPSPAAVPKK